MDRDRPNFSTFFNPPSCTKQSSTNQSTQNTSSQQHKPNNNSILHFLPQTQQPTSQRAIQFYKIKQRLTSEMFTTRIGYRIRQYSRVQQDYICYLTQLIMVECQGIKVYVIEPNYLYFEASSVYEEGQEQINQNKEKQRQEIQLENGMFRFLKHVSKEIFNPWMDTYLQPSRLTSSDFSEEKVIESFTKQVIEKIKQKHQEVFTVIKGKKTQQ